MATAWPCAAAFAWAAAQWTQEGAPEPLADERFLGASLEQ